MELGESCRKDERGNRKMITNFKGIKRLPDYLKGELSTQEAWDKILDDGPILPRCFFCGERMHIRILEYLVTVKPYNWTSSSLFIEEAEMDLVLECSKCGSYIMAKGKGLHVSNEGFWIEEIEVKKVGRRI